MKRKGRIRSKLSLKIILTHFGIIFVISLVIALLFRILNYFNYSFTENHKKLDIWIVLFPVIYGSTIVLIFSYVINKILIVRIRKLKAATSLVAKGNFNNTIKVVGTDELSELTDSFNKMTIELQANEYLSKDFVRNISHEFKTPLSVVKAYGELIGTEAMKESIDRSALIEYSQIIMDEADRLSALSKSIIQLSLLDSTTIIRKEDRFSPAEQIRNMLRTMHVQWVEKNIQFELDLDDTLITSNEQLLYQVWQNLINNAIKFSLENGIIIITLRIDAERLCFKITDFGIGIKAENEKNIFTHFFMGDKSRNKEGSGLGLAIVKTIIDKLNGTINYESNEESGTQFTITLNEILH